MCQSVSLTSGVGGACGVHVVQAGQCKISNKLSVMSFGGCGGGGCRRRLLELRRSTNARAAGSQSLGVSWPICCGGLRSVPVTFSGTVSGWRIVGKKSRKVSRRWLMSRWRSALALVDDQVGQVDGDMSIWTSARSPWCSRWRDDCPERIAGWPGLFDRASASRIGCRRLTLATERTAPDSWCPSLRGRWLAGPGVPASRGVAIGMTSAAIVVLALYEDHVLWSR